MKSQKIITFFSHKFTKRILEIIVILFIALIAGMLSMFAAYSIPISKIQAHVTESIDILENESDSYGFAPRVSTSYPDHITDALMICEAVAPRTASVIDDAINANWISLDSYNNVQTLINAFGKGMYDKTTVTPYPRYWHGYLIFLKPLLACMSYSEIRILAMWVQLALLCLAIHELLKKDRKLAIAFFTSFLFLNPITSALSIQYASIYCITLLFTIILVRYNVYLSEKCWILFMLAGISTAFFDLLTYPVVALGIPLIIFTALTSEMGIRKNIKKIFEHSLSFSIGYAGMWGGKWIIASLFTDNNTIDNAISQISYRMTAEESSQPLTVTYVLRQVLMHLNNKPMKIFVLMFALIVLLSLLCQKSIVVISKNIIPMLLIALYPFAWYILVRNHSATHSRLEQRELAVTIMALIFSVLINLKPKAFE